jgi:hypothetical protein
LKVSTESFLKRRQGRAKASLKLVQNLSLSLGASYLRGAGGLSSGLATSGEAACGVCGKCWQPGW